MYGTKIKIIAHVLIVVLCILWHWCVCWKLDIAGHMLHNIIKESHSGGLCTCFGSSCV